MMVLPEIKQQIMAGREVTDRQMPLPAAGSFRLVLGLWENQVQVCPIIRYVLGTCHKHLLILTRRDHARLQVPAKLFFFFSPWKYFSNKLAFFDGKKTSKILPNGAPWQGTELCYCQLLVATLQILSVIWKAHFGYFTTISPFSCAGRRGVTCSQQCCCPSGSPTVRWGCEIKRAQAPLWQDGGSFLRSIASQRPQPGVILAPLLLLGNLAAAGTVSTLSSCPGDLSPSPQEGMLLCHVSVTPRHGVCVGCRRRGSARGEAGPAVGLFWLSCGDSRSWRCPGTVRGHQAAPTKAAGAGSGHKAAVQRHCAQTH